VVDFHLCVYTACLFVIQSQLRIGAEPRKTPNASLANYWKEGQGRFQFVVNISQRRAEAARKGVAVFADRESRGYSNFARNPLRAWKMCVCVCVYITLYFVMPILRKLAILLGFIKRGNSYKQECFSYHNLM